MGEWVLDGCCEVLQLEEALRQGFDKDKFLFHKGEQKQATGDEGEGGYEGVSIAKVEEVISSSFFWCYAHMVAAVGSVLQHISSWAETCSCHSSSLNADPGHVKTSGKPYPRENHGEQPWNLSHWQG